MAGPEVIRENYLRDIIRSVDGAGSPPTDDPPIFTGTIPDALEKYITTITPIDITPFYTGDIAGYGVTGAPEGITCDIDTGIISGKPEPTEFGDYVLTAYAGNSGGLAPSNDFTMTLEASNTIDPGVIVVDAVVGVNNTNGTLAPREIDGVSLFALEANTSSGYVRITMTGGVKPFEEIRVLYEDQPMFIVPPVSGNNYQQNNNTISRTFYNNLLDNVGIVRPIHLQGGNIFPYTSLAGGADAAPGVNAGAPTGHSWSFSSAGHQYVSLGNNNFACRINPDADPAVRRSLQITLQDDITLEVGSTYQYKISSTLEGGADTTSLTATQDVGITIDDIVNRSLLGQTVDLGVTFTVTDPGWGLRIIVGCGPTTNRGETILLQNPRLFEVIA